MVLSLHRLLDTNSKYAELNDKITAVLIKRIEASSFGLLQSYPGEVYSVDNCAVIGSIGLHGKATGKDYTLLVSTWIDNFRKRCVDRTGLLFQALDCNSCEAIDLPRGSGTALGLYMISFADQNFAATLYSAMRSQLTRNIFGFGGVREYIAGTTGKYGDIDSGPVVFGFGLSATGFAISGARLCYDQSYYSRLYATAYAWGAPYQRDGKLNFVTGASLGDAIMFAMLTAPKGGLK